MSYYKLSVPDLLHEAGKVSTNARDADLLARLDPAGYGEDALTDLDALIAEVEGKKEDRETNYGDQLDSTQSIAVDWRDFYDKTYMRHVGIARAVFRGKRGTLARLGLNGPRRRDKAGRYDQALKLYTNAIADADLVDKLAVRGLDAVTLQAGLDAVKAIEKADHEQDTHIGLAQQSTDDRRKAERDLTDWLTEFRDVAREVFYDKPDWLERLGIFHRSDG